MDTIEVRKVSNGYMVLPTYQNTARITDGTCVHVFETFEALVRFLKDNFKETDAPENKVSDE